MKQLEVFKYATVLYFNMGYYNISLLPARQDMKTIVTGFGKFRYTRLPMVMCASGDIFQAKVDELLGDIKDIKTYIGDIIILSKDYFKKHIEQLRIIFGRFHAAGFKVKDPK